MNTDMFCMKASVWSRRIKSFFLLMSVFWVEILVSSDDDEDEDDEEEEDVEEVAEMPAHSLGGLYSVLFSIP